MEVPQLPDPPQDPALLPTGKSIDPYTEVPVILCQTNNYYLSLGLLYIRKSMSNHQLSSTTSLSQVVNSVSNQQPKSTISACASVV